MKASSGSGVGCNQQIRNSATESSTGSGKTERMSIINMSPVDEVEGELVYYQHQLLRNAAARKHINGLFIFAGLGFLLYIRC